MIENAARKSTRAVVDLTPRYRTPASFDFVEGRCIDLSEGGMFITAPLPCESGTLLKFECSVGAHGGNDVAVKGVARVVWRRTGDGERPSGMGLKFVKLEPGSPEVINQLVADAKEHGMTAPEAPLAAQVRVTDSFVPGEQDAASVRPKAEAVAAAELPHPPGGASSESAVVGPKRSSLAPSAATSVRPGSKAQSGGSAIWIALAVAGALLVWLLVR